MPEAIGALILTAVADAGVESAAAFSTATFLGVSGATAVGSAAILGATIGLQYALANPNVPAPQNGAQPLKQAFPPRVRGYWINRLPDITCFSWRQEATPRTCSPSIAVGSSKSCRSICTTSRSRSFRRLPMG